MCPQKTSMEDTASNPLHHQDPFCYLFPDMQPIQETVLYECVETYSLSYEVHRVQCQISYSCSFSPLSRFPLLALARLALLAPPFSSDWPLQGGKMIALYEEVWRRRRGDLKQWKRLGVAQKHPWVCLSFCLSVCCYGAVYISSYHR